MTENILKATELTGIIGRSEIDSLSSTNDDKWQKYSEMYNLASELSIETEYPLQIDFELNASCNLACPMCPVSTESKKGRGKDTWFPFDEFKKIIDDGVKNGLMSIKLNYINEPLIRKDIVKFIKYAVDAGVLDVYFSTNGVLLDDNFIRKIIKSGLTRIQVSIDSVSSEIYDIVRPGGDYNKVVDNVIKIKRIRDELGSITPLIRVNFVRMDINNKEADKFIEQWSDKVDMIGMQEFIEPPNTNVTKNTTKTAKKQEFRCSFPFKQLVIASDYKVLPCCTFWGREMPIIDYKGIESIKRAWNSNKMRELRKIHLEGHFHKNSVCSKCVNGSVG